MANELSKTEIKEIKIEQNNIDDLNSKLANEFEIIENSFIVQSNVALMKNSYNGDYDEWKEKQKITREQLKKDLKKSEENCKKIVDKSLDNTLIDVNKAITMISNVKTEKVDRANIKAIANKGISLCSDQALKNFDKSVAKVYKLRNQEPLFDAILKQTQEGIENGLKIAYKNGRLVSFKSYMEMNVRTTTRQEANEYLFKASKSNGVVFYISSTFGDCADDHKEFQGKYYYDADWKSFGYDEETSKKIKETISRYQMRSYQDVVNNKPYLTTRPNCRHTLRPVVLDDVFSKSPKTISEEYKIIKGTYHDRNYKALQRQRYNERMIRKYKTRLENNKLLYEQNPNPKLNQLIKNDEALIKHWNQEQLKLLKKYTFLKRDKRREDNKILLQDAGAGYSLGLKIDGKNMFFETKTNKDIFESKGKNKGKKYEGLTISKPIRPKRKNFDNIESYENAKQKYYQKLNEYNDEVEKKAQSFLNRKRNITNYNDFKKWCDKHNIEIDDSVKLLDARALGDYAEYTEELNKKYPEFLEWRRKNNVRFQIGYNPNETAAATASSPNGLGFGFTFGNSAKDYKTYVKEQLESHSEGWTVRGNGNIKGLYVHEYGHEIMNMIKNKLYYQKDNMKLIKKFTDDIQSLANKKGVSEYALTNESELFAEGFAEYELGDSEFGKAFGKILKEWLKWK